jgi:hypothetical protein
MEKVKKKKAIKPPPKKAGHCLLALLRPLTPKKVGLRRKS